MDITQIDDEISKENVLIEKENELLKNEIELLKNEITFLKENCIYTIKIDTLLPKDLSVKKGNSTDEFITIDEGGIQYGPYLYYEQGKYLIIYNGENLLNAKFDIHDMDYNFIFLLQL